MIDFWATRDESEREDDEAERLVRPAPKQRPPRHDRRRNRVDSDQDHDTRRDPDLSGDPDLSLNFKTIGGSWIREGNRKEFSKFIKDKTFRNQETGENVQFASLPAGQQEAIRDKFKSDREQEQGQGAAKTKPTEMEPLKPLSREDAVRLGQGLEDRAAEDPKFASLLEDMLRRDSLTGGMIRSEANKDKLLSEAMLKVTFPEGLRTVGDLYQALTEVALKRKRPKSKNPRPKKEGPPKEPSAPTPSGPAPKEPSKPAAKEPSAPDPSGPAPKDPSEPAPSEPSTPAPSGPAPKDPQDPSAPSEPEPAPKPRKWTPDRPEVSREEVYQARQSLLAIFPPDVAVKFFTTHPQDVRRLIDGYRAVKETSFPTAQHLTDTYAKLRETGYSGDLQSITPPKVVQTDKGEVPFEDLPRKQQADAVVNHRMDTMAVALAVGDATRDRLTKAGAPPQLAKSISEFILTAPYDPTHRQAEAKKRAEEGFFDTLSSRKLIKEDPTEELDSRFDSEESEGGRFGPGRSQLREDLDSTSAKARERTFAQLAKISPEANLLAAAHYQGEDLRAAREEYFGAEGATQETSYQTARRIYHGALSLRKSEDSYPEEVRTHLQPTWRMFRDRALQSIQALDPQKHAEVVKQLGGLDEEFHQEDLREYKKVKKKYDIQRGVYRKQLDSWLKELHSWQETNHPYRKPFGKAPPTPPIEPQEPVRPFGGANDPQQTAKGVMDGFLRSAAYSYYPMPTVSCTRAPNKDLTMAAKVASEDAHPVLNQLDKLAGTIQQKFASLGLSPDTAKALVNHLDRIADSIEVAAYGEGSLAKRQLEVVGQVIQRDPNQPHLDTFNSPTRVIQRETDQPYLSAFDDDETSAVRKVTPAAS